MKHFRTTISTFLCATAMFAASGVKQPGPRPAAVKNYCATHPGTVCQNSDTLLSGFQHPTCVAQDANGNTWVLNTNNDATDPYTGSMMKVNSTNTSILGTKNMTAYFRLSSAVGVGSSIWVVGTTSNGGADIVQFNGSTGATQNTVSGILTSGAFPANLTISYDGTFIWVGGNGAAQMARINPSTLAVTNYTVATAPNSMVADTAGHVWMTAGINYPGHKNLVGIGQDGSAFGSYAFAGSDLEDIAFDGTKLWITDFYNKTVFNLSIYGSGGVVIHNIFANNGWSPWGVASDGIDTWVTSDEAQSVFKFNGSDGTIDNIFATDASPGKPFFFGTLGLGGKIWIPDYFQGSLTMITVPSGT